MVIFLAHCILNQNSRASGIAKRRGPIREVLEILLHHGVGIVQMPCPELLYLGPDRPTHDKEWYDREDFRELCRKLAEDVATLLEMYLKGGYKVLGIVGIEHSPSCAVESISLIIQGEKTYVEGKGIFMEELSKTLTSKGLTDIPLKGFLIDEEGIRDICNWLKNQIEKE